MREAFPVITGKASHEAFPAITGKASMASTSAPLSPTSTECPAPM